MFDQKRHIDPATTGPQSTTDGVKMPVLHFDHVAHHYSGSGLIVDDLSFSLYDGQTICLLGPSGCGKSTTLRLAAGLEQPTAGEIFIDGRAVATSKHIIPPEERDIGLVFQDYALFPHLTVGQNIAFGIKDLPKAERRQRVADVLSLVGLPDRGEAMPHELSGGQQQRVALGRALVKRPRLLLLDEPFSGLDARLRDEIRDQTLHILKEAGIAALLVTHDAEEAMFMADQIIVMRDGKAEQKGQPYDLYFHPANAFIAEFFGEVNHLPGVVEDEHVDTIFGPLPAIGFSNGQQVDIVVRPEALSMDCDCVDGLGCEAKVLDSRLLGRASLVHLSVDAEGFAPAHLHARHKGRFCVLDGSIQPVCLDPEQVFIFPKGDR